MTPSVRPDNGEAWGLVAVLIAIAAVFGLAAGCGIGWLYAWMVER